MRWYDKQLYYNNGTVRRGFAEKDLGAAMKAFPALVRP
ncbi:hypothetical protein HMPREF1249_0710 [Jonquetella sp. BV3C21]|nr:hypothetical protein HMPREF1249_0710 [Jonquetella sp. BV3C21]